MIEFPKYFGVFMDFLGFLTYKDKIEQIFTIKDKEKIEQIFTLNPNLKS
jgi:hypothetical protein